MTNKSAVYTNNLTFNAKYLVLIVALLNDFKLIYSSCNIDESKATWLVKSYSSKPLRSVIKVHADLPSERAQSHKKEPYVVFGNCKLSIDMLLDGCQNH